MNETVTFRYKSTIARITSETEFIKIAEDEIIRRYNEIENYIAYYPAFGKTLKPYQVKDDADRIVREMADAGRICGVGPMAAVAGAIAKYAVLAMQKAGANFAIVDNGGDIAILNDQPVVVGIYCGPAEIHDLGLRLPARSTLTGVCTSSGVIGHSLSFGRAHASVIISDDPILADAAATALGNRIRTKNPVLLENAMQDALKFGVAGCIVIIDDFFGFAGEIPELCQVEMNENLIAK
ncbi:MAG: UPF0280 family protein [Candidatus Marinimicrobia bacterium]|jgi:hypothetical protein|nr:UPF0280 family protein [Candidatus Neomarinimicrobiota bacterium]MDD5061487.1 UPF0280 family protein [Candidatus Neomarinimicrobiota bacterium]